MVGSLAGTAQNGTAQTLFTEAQWRYELASRALYGGELPAPSGASGDVYQELNQRRYRAALSYVDDRSSILRGSSLVPFLGVLNAGDKTVPQAMVETLRQFHFQAELVDVDQSFDRYPLLLLSAVDDLPERYWKKVEQFVSAGGILVTSIREGMAFQSRLEINRAPLFERNYFFFGFHVMCRAPGGANGYIRLLPQVRRRGADRGCLVKGPFWDVLAPRAEKLGSLIVPWQNLFYGFVYLQAPPDQESLSPGVLMAPYGKGKVVFFALPVFHALASTGFICLQNTLADMIAFLAPRPPFRLEGPPNLEANLYSSADRFVLNLLYYYPNRALTNRLDIDESIPLGDLSVAVRTPRSPDLVRLRPVGQALRHEYVDGYTIVTVPGVREWQILEIRMPGSRTP